MRINFYTSVRKKADSVHFEQKHLNLELKTEEICGKTAICHIEKDQQFQMKMWYN